MAAPPQTPSWKEGKPEEGKPEGDKE
jgi:hypothetical protein